MRDTIEKISMTASLTGRNVGMIVAVVAFAIGEYEAAIWFVLCVMHLVLVEILWIMQEEAR